MPPIRVLKTPLELLLDLEDASRMHRYAATQIAQARAQLAVLPARTTYYPSPLAMSSLASAPSLVPRLLQVDRKLPLERMPHTIAPVAERVLPTIGDSLPPRRANQRLPTNVAEIKKPNIKEWISQKEDSAETTVTPKKKKTLWPRAARNKKSREQARQDTYDELWMAMYERLLRFKRLRGHCLVPQKFEPDQKLATWVKLQRRRKVRGELSDERHKRLEQVGFVWSLRGVEKWENMFQRLINYKKENGDTLVPQFYKKDGRLGNWVQKQRCIRSQGKLAPERVEQLESLGFIWDARKYCFALRKGACSKDAEATLKEKRK